VIVAGERLPGHLLGRQQGQVGDLPADALERAPGLRLDVAPCGGQKLLALALALLGRLRPGGIGRLPGAGDDVVRLLSRLLEASPVFGQELVGLLPGLLRVFDRLPDRIGALVERFLNPREGNFA
jgi:hypothetical protein